MPLPHCSISISFPFLSTSHLARIVQIGCMALVHSLTWECCGSALWMLLLVMLAVGHLPSIASDVCRWPLGAHTFRRPITC